MPQNAPLKMHAPAMLPYSHELDTLFSDLIGPLGLDRGRFGALTDAIGEHAALLRNAPSANADALFRSCTDTKDLAAIEALAQRWRREYDRLLVIGSGGSGLSARTVAALTAGTDARQPVHVLDNLDTVGMQRWCARELDSTAVLVISKSGNTVETLAQLQALLQVFPKNADKRAQMAVITVKSDNPLRGWAEKNQVPVFDHDPDLGGRFSLLSAVGLIPAAYLGLDIRALRAGGMTALEHMDEAVQGAAMHVAAMQSGHNIRVILPYAEQLTGIALWWRQSWAESIGKGGMGSTPVVALGTTDQHSQLQLWLAGPRDKYFTLLLAECEGTGARLDGDALLPGLSGKTIGDIVAAMQKATLKTLAQGGCPVRVFRLPAINEMAVGALMMQHSLEIILSAASLGIDPFDQPAVEESKRLAREYLA